MLVAQQQELIQTGTVARMLELSMTQVQRLIARGELPVTMRTAEGIRLFDRTVVEALRRERQENPPRPGRKAKRITRKDINRTK